MIKQVEINDTQCFECTEYVEYEFHLTSVRSIYTMTSTTVKVFSVNNTGESCQCLNHLQLRKF